MLSTGSRWWFSFTFVNVLLLGLVAWAVAGHGRGRRVWPGAPVSFRRRARLAVEVAFGLINPLLYLAILAPATPGLRSGAEWWRGPLEAGAWALLAAVWGLRMFGAALDPASRAGRALARILLGAALLWVMLFGAKDLWYVVATEGGPSSWIRLGLNVLRLCPLYLIPAVLLGDYLRSWRGTSEEAVRVREGLFLMRGRAARTAVWGVAGLLLATMVLAAGRRSEASVRGLVSVHREAIRDAAARYGADAKLIAAIVYVTHRDQLSPFREELERMAVAGWAMNMRVEAGTGPPDNIEQYGTDENPLLHRSLDISVGLAQIKPRTAQTASVLATGAWPDELPRPAF